MSTAIQTFVPYNHFQMCLYCRFSCVVPCENGSFNSVTAFVIRAPFHGLSQSCETSVFSLLTKAVLEEELHTVTQHSLHSLNTMCKNS